MSLLSNLIGGGAKLADSASHAFNGKFVSRFGGLETMGAVTRAVDTRTTTELLGNIEYCAAYNADVAKFKEDLKTINPKHLGLVSDICELGSTCEMLPDAINLRAVNGKNILKLLLERLPKASKENPEAVEFFQEVINNTDSRASKVFMARAYEMLAHPELAKHMAATKPLVGNIAKSTLTGGYTMDYRKENLFTDVIGSYVNPSVKSENIEVISEAANAVRKLPKEMELDCFVDCNTILNGNTKQMRENLDTFSQIAEGLSKKTTKFDLSDFITRNVNLY